MNQVGGKSSREKGGTKMNARILGEQRLMGRKDGKASRLAQTRNRGWPDGQGLVPKEFRRDRT